MPDALPLPEPRKMSLRLARRLRRGRVAPCRSPRRALHAQTDADFLAAKEAFERGERKKLDLLAPALSGHVLAPYVAYWQLKSGIDTADYVAVRAFLAQNANTPLAERLTHRLAEVAREARRLDALRARLRAGRPARTSSSRATASSIGASVTATPRWAPRSRCGSTGQATPDACEPLFQALFAKGELTDADRARAFPAGRRERQPARRAGDRGGFAPRRRSHRRANSRAIDTDRAARPRARGVRLDVTSGAGPRAVRARARGAHATRTPRTPAWIKWRDRLPVAAREYGNARVAFHARAPAAAGGQRVVSRRGGGAADARPAGVARARGAPRLELARRARRDRAMPERDQQDAAWRYWKARALAATGDDCGGRRAVRDAGHRGEFLRVARRRGARARRGAVGAAEERPATADARSVRRLRRAAGGSPRTQARGARHAAGVAARMGLRRARTGRRRAAAWPRSTRAAMASTTARSTLPSAPSRATTTACAT